MHCRLLPSAVRLAAVPLRPRPVPAARRPFAAAAALLRHAAHAAKADVDPLAAARKAEDVPPQPTAAEAVVAAENSDVDPLKAKEAAQVPPQPTAAEAVVAAENSAEDPLKKAQPALPARPPVPTASEETVAGEKSEVDPLAEAKVEESSETAKGETEAAAAPTASEEAVAAEKSGADPLASGQAVVKPKKERQIRVVEKDGKRQIAHSAPTTPSGVTRNLRTEPGSLLVREFVNVDDGLHPIPIMPSAQAIINADPFARFDPTFLGGPGPQAVPYAPRETVPPGKKYGTEHDAAYAHLPAVSYFAVWPNLAGRPLARTILEEATRLELAGMDRQRVVTALERLKYSTVPSDMAAALRNPDGQKMLRVVLLHRHDTYFAPDDHVIRRIWDKYGAMAAREQSPEYEIEFDYMVWDDRATVIAVRDVRLLAPAGDATDGFFQTQDAKAFWALPANTHGRFFMELSNATRDTTYPIDLYGDFMKAVGSVTPKADLPEFGRWGRNDNGSFLKLDGLRAKGQFRARVWDYLDGHEF